MLVALAGVGIWVGFFMVATIALGERLIATGLVMLGGMFLVAGIVVLADTG